MSFSLFCYSISCSLVRFARYNYNICLYLSLQSNLSGHKNIIGYVDSSITHAGNGVYEVLLLMPYCKVNMLAMMNAR